MFTTLRIEYNCETDVFLNGDASSRLFYNIAYYIHDVTWRFRVRVGTLDIQERQGLYSYRIF